MVLKTITEAVTSSAALDFWILCLEWLIPSYPLLPDLRHCKSCHDLQLKIEINTEI